MTFRDEAAIRYNYGDLLMGHYFLEIGVKNFHIILIVP